MTVGASSGLVESISELGLSAQMKQKHDNVNFNTNYLNVSHLKQNQIKLTKFRSTVYKVRTIILYVLDIKWSEHTLTLSIFLNVRLSPRFATQFVRSCVLRPSTSLSWLATADDIRKNEWFISRSFRLQHAYTPQDNTIVVIFRSYAWLVKRNRTSCLLYAVLNAPSRRLLFTSITPALWIGNSITSRENTL